MDTIAPASRSEVVDWLGEEITKWIEENHRKVDRPYSIHFTANIPWTMWCVDIDGTITPPGERVSLAAVNLLHGMVNNITLITAQALDYCRGINVGDFPNLVTEKGFFCRIRGTETILAPPPQVSALVEEMRDLLTKLDGGLFINEKQAGYAVGHPPGRRPANFNEVLALMEEQSARHTPNFVVEETSGFVDITLADLSKANSLKAVMNKFPGFIAIAAGDSPTTDGPMLRAAERGIMVKNKLQPFPTVESPGKMLALLAWFAKLLSEGPTSTRF